MSGLALVSASCVSNGWGAKLLGHVWALQARRRRKASQILRAPVLGVVVFVCSRASATSLGEGSKGHTPDPPQQNPTGHTHQLALTGLLSCLSQHKTPLVRTFQEVRRASGSLLGDDQANCHSSPCLLLYWRRWARLSVDSGMIGYENLKSILNGS